MPSIGPYRFTDTDTARTLANAADWWHQLTGDVDASVLDGRQLVVDDTADPAAELARVWSTMLDAGAALRSSGALPTAGGGRVDRINRSDGGVPKLPVEAVEVDFAGVVGDRQGNRTHHGRPWQALCLWSTEVIAAFAAEGHPLVAGAAGENLTISGFDWAAMHAGLRLRIGSVLAETTMWAVPCRHNAQWFTDGRFDRMHADRGPVSRIYATVIEPGRIATGDAMTLEA